MRSKAKALDRFQIAGFALSATASVVFIAIGQDTIPSVSVGLILAVLVQLFDLQLRFSASEGKLLDAGRLNKELFADEWLQSHIRSIVNDYLQLRDSWLQVFRIHANDAIIECGQRL